MNNRFREIKLLFPQLEVEQQQSVVDYATFLLQRYKIKNTRDRDLEPKSIERPQKESVIAAIKRLKKSYYMLDTDIILDETSVLMAQHVMKGREASDVIDELQSIFHRQYEQYRNQ